MTEATPDRLLRIDLTRKTVESERVPERWLRRYVGGKGLGARYLYSELDAGVDPLGPENVLLFMLGPLSGLLPGEQRYAAVTKSPLTGAFLDSYSGGTFPGTLAGALCDHIGVLVTGQADSPVVIEIEDGAATVEPAADLWGEDTVATCEGFSDATVACIGPAGENRVSYATIATDGGDHHAGRGGAGAVMGAKQLKALVVRGDPPAGLDDLREKYERRFERDDTGRWQATSETLESIDFANEVGALSTRGWQDGRFEGAEDIGIEAAKTAASGREHDGESIPGGFRVSTDEGETVPRGATPMTLGAGLGIDDFDAVAVLGGVCDRLGLDVISGGSAVAWTMRASDEGTLDRGLNFGDDAGARALIEEIAERETPLGDALAAGVDTAAARFGSEEVVPTVKQMELPAYDPRGAASMALAYATSDRGACHRRARPIEREAFTEEWGPDETARAVIAAQDRRSVLWSLVADDFVGDVFADFGVEWLAAVGHEYTEDDLQTAAERIWTLTRLFNVREGFSRADDSLSPVLERPLGDSTERAVDRGTFEASLDAYYERRGWSEDGHPTRATLSRIGLGDVVDGETPVGEERRTHGADSTGEHDR